MTTLLRDMRWSGPDDAGPGSPSAPRARSTIGMMMLAILGVTLTLVGGAMTAAGRGSNPKASAATVLGMQMTRLGDGVRLAAPDHIEGLERGDVGDVEIDLRNTGASDAEVRDLVIAVSDASPECRGHLVAVAPIADPIAVAAGDSTTIRVDVTLDASAPANCESRGFPVSYAAVIASS